MAQSVRRNSRWIRRGFWVVVLVIGAVVIAQGANRPADPSLAPVGATTTAVG